MCLVMIASSYFFFILFLVITAIINNPCIVPVKEEKKCHCQCCLFTEVPASLLATVGKSVPHFRENDDVSHSAGYSRPRKITVPRGKAYRTTTENTADF